MRIKLGSSISIRKILVVEHDKLIRMRQYILKLIMAMALLPVSMAAMAYDYDFSDDGIRYSIISEEDRTVSVAKNSAYYSKGDIVIPSKVMYDNKSYAVIAIGACAFFECGGLTSIDIPGSVTTIGGEAFYGCDGLTSIDIPGSVATIGDSAFQYCYGLTSIKISDGVITIGDGAFQYCYGLTSIDIPGSVTTIGEDAFYGCYGLTLINISDGVTTIGEDAFHGCDGLTSIDIPGSVATIGGGAFYDCNGLTSINISDGVTTIGGGAFSNCDGLMAINVSPNNNYYTSIDGVLYSKDVLKLIRCPEGKAETSFDIPGSVIIIGDGAFSNCDGLTSIDIPGSVTTIGDYAFFGCDGLTSIDIPGSVTTIGEEAFYGCDGLTSIDIPGSVTTISDHAFEGCYGLTLIKISDGVTTIGDYAFSGCDGLTSIDIPGSVTTIGRYAFSSGCQDVIIYCRSIVPPKGGNTIFSSNTLKSGCLYVPIGTKADYEAVDPWRNFWNIEELDGLIVPVESLAITDKSVVMNENETYQLSALISPENATYKTLLWQSSDEDIATVDEDGLVTSYGNFGTVEISATTRDGSNLTASCTVTVAAKSGIGYIEAEGKIDVRAADGNIYIINKPKGKDCFIYNIGGTLVSVTKDDAIYGLEQGVYVVRIGTFVKKVVL